MAEETCEWLQIYVLTCVVQHCPNTKGQYNINTENTALKLAILKH